MGSLVASRGSMGRTRRSNKILGWLGGATGKCPPVQRSLFRRSYTEADYGVGSPERGGHTPSKSESGPYLLTLGRAILGHPASDLPLYSLRLFGYRACQCSKVVSRIMELINQRHNDWQARVVEAHAVVQVAGQRHARLVDPVEQVALLVVMRCDDSFLDPDEQHLLLQIRVPRDEFAFADHVKLRPSYAGSAGAPSPSRP